MDKRTTKPGRVVKSPKKTIEKPVSEKDIGNAFRKVAKTPEGRLVFQWLMNHCGFKTSSLAINQDMAKNPVIDTVGTIHNEAKRSVWLFARKLIPWDLRNLIEAERAPDVPVPQELDAEA